MFPGPRSWIRGGEKASGVISVFAGELLLILHSREKPRAGEWGQVVGEAGSDKVSVC